MIQTKPCCRITTKKTWIKSKYTLDVAPFRQNNDRYTAAAAAESYIAEGIMCELLHAFSWRKHLGIDKVIKERLFPDNIHTSVLRSRFEVKL